MPGTARIAPGETVFHVLNRGVGRIPLVKNDEDFNAFERIIRETLVRRPMRICAYCLMPNHWHLLLWPERDGDLASFMQSLTNTHVQRWQQHYHVVGHGHVYQGRYKSFPVESDKYFYLLSRGAVNCTLSATRYAKRLGLQSTLRGRDRPPKHES